MTLARSRGHALNCVIKRSVAACSSAQWLRAPIIDLFDLSAHRYSIFPHTSRAHVCVTINFSVGRGWWGAARKLGRRVCVRRRGNITAHFEQPTDCAVCGIAICQCRCFKHYPCARTHQYARNAYMHTHVRSLTHADPHVRACSFCHEHTQFVPRTNCSQRPLQKKEPMR